MGNLCSSGAERAEKKEDNQLPDKPRDGEDEALLPKGEAAVELNSDGVQVSSSAGDGGGLGEALGAAVSQGKSALSDVSGSMEAESHQLASQSQSAFTRVTQTGKDGVDKSIQDVKSGAAAAADDVATSSQTAVEDVKAAVEETVTSAKAATQDAAAKGVATVKDNIDEVVQQVSQQAAVVTDSVSSSISNATEAAVSGIQSSKEEANNAGESIDEALTETSKQALSNADNAVNKIDEISTEIESKARADFESINNEANSLACEVSDTVDAGAEQTFCLQSEKSLQEDILDKFEELKSSTLNSTGSVQQTAQEKVIETVESVQQSAQEKVNETVDSVQQSAQEKLIETVDSVQQSAQEKVIEAVDSVQQSAQEKVIETVDSAQQSAQEKVIETVDSVQQSVSQTAADLSDQLKQTVDTVSEKIVGITQDATDEVDQSANGVGDNVAPTIEKLEAEVQESVTETQTVAFDASEKVSGEAQSLVSGGVQLVNETSRAADETATNVESTLSESQQLLKDEASQAVTSAVDATVSTAEDVERETFDASSVVKENISEEIAEVTDAVQLNAEESLSPTEKDESTAESGLDGRLNETVQSVLQSGVEFVQEKVVESFQGETKEEVSDAVSDVTEAEEQITKETDGSKETCFLEKAKSLLDAHRNSLDESKTVSFEGARENINAGQEIEEAVGNVVEEVVKDNEDAVSPPRPDSVESLDDSEATEAAQEATARDFVESIIEKATSLVAESFNKGEEEDEVSTPSEASVERGEETIEPKKRGVMFVSPQLSEQSSLPLSSPQELSPPPVLDDLSPTSDGTNSSMSQNESADKEELFSSPVSAPTIIFNVNENNNNNNILNNNTEEDDESFQRVAMEVTTKAVQDAIKIVTENGTGSFLSNPALCNDLGVSSPSSTENDEEEMTTTDSSQVERGSPVSDITDTSAQGSVCESLSSYDPGAVFRQDVANMADLVTSPIDNISPSESTSAASDFPAAPPNAATNNDLISFEDCSSSQANTPTNASLVDTYPPPQLPANEDQTSSDAKPTFNEVPSSLSFDDDFANPGKPTIIINSPDSAHHTNGSAEDLTTSQSEALI